MTGIRSPEPAHEPRRDASQRAPDTGRLARLGFERTDLAADSLTRLGACPPVEGSGAELLVDLAASANPDLAARVLADLVTAGEQAPEGGVAAGLLDALHHHPLFRQRLITLVAASRSLGTWLIAHIDEIDRLADEPRFTDPVRGPQLRADALETVALHAGETEEPQPAAWAALRRFRRREFMRIAARDLTGTDGTEAVGRALARLAEACLEAALWLVMRPYGERPPVRLSLLGMGKLGASELNYVSDLDLLACHEAAEGVSAEAAARAAARVIRQVVAGLSDASTEGVGYRIDFNLRPEGRDGPLSRTLPAYVAYWDRWAEAWEFQALIKVRPVAGDRELGERFCAEALPRVYPDQLGADAIDEIRRMKARVEESVRARAEAERHVKLGFGGIRDIEWAVQLLQLVHARQDPGLRARSTLTALTALADAQLVGRGDAERLADAYRFQRTVEHRLQLVDERRTHTLPTDEAEQAWLARILGYTGADRLDRFRADYRRHAQAVRSLHEKLFYRPLLEVFGAVPPLAPGQVRDRLVSLGFAAPDRALQHLRALTAGLSRSAALMRVALPVMLPSIAASPDPDGGLLALRALAERLDDRPAFLQMLRENPVAAEQLCVVLGTSPILGELLQRHPDLVDAFADDRRFGRVDGAQQPDLTGEAGKIVRRLAGDPAEAWDGLRRFRRREFVRIAVRELLGLDTTAKVGEGLADLADACLTAGLWLALRPYGETPPVRLGLLGMGKLGGRELSYTSDLDLLACHEPAHGAGAQEAAHAALQVVRNITQGLGSISREGTGYKIDFNLRPEGRDGPLSRTLVSYITYWDRWAEPWEFQSLTKVRPVAGDRDLTDRFCAAAAQRVYPAQLDDTALAEIRKTKARVETERLPRGADPALHLKLGPGGITDVEWTVQLEQLALGGTHPEVRSASTRDALRRLEAAHVLDKRDTAWLADAYDLLTRLRDLGYLVTGRPLDSLPTDPATLNRLAHALAGDGEESDSGRQRLLETYRRVTRRARGVVEEHFWGGRLASG